MTKTTRLYVEGIDSASLRVALRSFTDESTYNTMFSVYSFPAMELDTAVVEAAKQYAEENNIENYVIIDETE